MIEVKILGNEYTIPENLTQVKLTKWIDYLEFYDMNAPEFFKEEQEEPLTPEQEMEYFEYCCKDIAFWTGCPYADLRKHPLEEIQSMYAYMQSNFRVQEDKNFGGIEIKGVPYFTLNRLLKEENLEDYAECNEYEKKFEGVINGQYEALFGLCAILCRKEGETFDEIDKVIDQRVELMKEHLNAWDAYQVGFFLQRQSDTLLNSSQIYIMSQALSQLKQATKN